MGRKRHNKEYISSEKLYTLYQDIHTLLAMLVKEGHPIPEDIINRYIKPKKEPVYEDRYEVVEGDVDDYDIAEPWDWDDLPF